MGLSVMQSVSKDSACVVLNRSIRDSSSCYDSVDSISHIGNHIKSSKSQYFSLRDMELHDGLSL